MEQFGLLKLCRLANTYVYDFVKVIFDRISFFSLANFVCNKVIIKDFIKPQTGRL